MISFAAMRSKRAATCESPTRSWTSWKPRVTAHRSKGIYPDRKGRPGLFERAYYLGADEGGGKAYRLLADAMEKSGRVALAEMIFHNREKLVLIRPVKGGLVLQFKYHEEEVRDFSPARLICPKQIQSVSDQAPWQKVLFESGKRDKGWASGEGDR
jgi:hypothetical protein